MNEITHDIVEKKGLPILFVIFTFLFIMETVSQLRVRNEKRLKRAVINALFSIPGVLALRLLLIPAMIWVAYKNQAWEFGLNYVYVFPLWLEGLIAFILHAHPAPTRKWLKSHEVRRLLTISPGTLQNLRVNGTLPFTKIGGVIFYDYEDIRKMLQDNKNTHDILRKNKPSRNV